MTKKELQDIVRANRILREATAKMAPKVERPRAEATGTPDTSNVSLAVCVGLALLVSNS